MIEIKNLGCKYGSDTILNNIDLTITPASFTAILGRNGSGKSTLAKHMNALIIPDSGKVSVDGIDTTDEMRIFDVRKKVGIVFQNPESQAVASIVEDDTAFAPENLGLSPSETEERVNNALAEVGITELRYRPISTLSGGQKQLTAIAGILAMQPEYMIFDEGSSMLDPAARRKLLECVLTLKNKLNIAIIWITHYMDEARNADRIIVLDKGKIIADGTPREIFSNSELIANSGLELPQSTQLSLRLKAAGFDIPYVALTPEECAKLILKGVIDTYDRA